MGESEVARLLEAIRLSYEAAERALTAPAITAPHAFITKHMENLAGYHEELISHVGKEKAIEFVAKVTLFREGSNDEASTRG